MERTSVPRGKRPRVQVSVDEKERAIARIRNGETKAGISRELGVPESTVRGWVKRADQRMARESSEGLENRSPPTLVAQAASLKVPLKRDHNGNVASTMPQSSESTPPLSTPVPMPLPMQLFQQAADSQLQLNGWLHIFNAGILNFTLIATAAYLRARERGATDHQSLWQIICEYVDEAGRNVAENGGQYVVQAGGSAAFMKPLSPQNHHYVSGTRHGSGVVAPRLHITAEDDIDEGPDAETKPTP